MRPAELATRLRQQAWKLLDRSMPWREDRIRFRDAIDRVPGSARFFPGAVEHRLGEALDLRVPDARGRIMREAEQSARGKFDLLGFRGLDFGDPIDWHLDPVSGRRAPARHWTVLDPLDGAAIGDSKIIWELSRHQWAVRLAQAYRLTGEERFASVAARQISRWMEANPRGVGINWTSSLEVAFRLIAWCWVLQLLNGTQALAEELRESMVSGIMAHATHVERYLSYYFSPNTHLTGEALGLFYAGVLFPGSRRAARWKSLGKRILERESARQILPDGIYFEQSTCYQRYTAEIYLHFLALAELNGVAVDPQVGARVQRLLDALLALLRPDRSMPNIGDADGGWLLPLDVRRPDDVRGVFSTAAVVFRRPEYVWAAQGLAPETLWFFGRAASDGFDQLQAAAPPGEPSKVFPDGGYVVLRSAWAEDANQVILDAGPLGCPYSSGHGHADLLSIQCALRGKPCVVDAGTFGYTLDPAWRRYFRGTAAHSTIEVDGVGQAVPGGPFAWDQRPRATLLGWGSDENLEFAQAEHGGYRRLSEAVTHRRTVILTRGGYCVVVDDLDGVGEHRLDARFQLAPLPARVGADEWVELGEGPAAILFIRAFSTAPLKAVLAEGDVEPRQGWISTDYGSRTAAPMVVYSLVGSLPLRVATMLFPVDARPAPPHVSPLVGSGLMEGLVVRERRETIRFAGLSAPRLERSVG